MSWPVIALLVTAALAVVAVVAAVVAVRAVREARHLGDRVVDAVGVSRPQEGDITVRDLDTPAPSAPVLDQRGSELEPRVVQGRVVVPPTQAQVVRTALGRPGVRLNVLLFGLRHALRPENRDRIAALMRREYRHRRYERLRAGRQAVRAAQPTSAPTTDRLHAQLAEPRPLSVVERMMS
jgi:hypothetical protein